MKKRLKYFQKPIPARGSNKSSGQLIRLTITKTNDIFLTNNSSLKAGSLNFSISSGQMYAETLTSLLESHDIETELRLAGNAHMQILVNVQTKGLNVYRANKYY